MGENEFGHNFAADKVLLNDALKDFWFAGMVPHGFRINDGDWSMYADAQTVGFGAIDQRLRVNQIQLLEPALEILPRLEANFPGSAFRFRLVRAEKNVAVVFGEAKNLGNFLEFTGHG